MMMLWILPLIIVPIAVALAFVIWYGRRNPKEEPENKEILENVERALKEGKITEEDAERIRESIEEE